MSNFIYYEKLEDYEEQVKKAKLCDNKDKEIERLNNIINELEKWAKEELEHPNWASCGARCMLNKLQELKGEDKE